MRLEVLMIVSMSLFFFCVVTPCGLVHGITTKNNNIVRCKINNVTVTEGLEVIVTVTLAEGMIQWALYYVIFKCILQPTAALLSCDS
jgi:hypothetical protein